METQVINITKTVKTVHGQTIGFDATIHCPHTFHNGTDLYIVEHTEASYAPFTVISRITEECETLDEAVKVSLKYCHMVHVLVEGAH